MHIDYELSQRDFVHGWLKVYLPPTASLWRSASQLAWLTFLAIFILQVVRQGLAEGISWLWVGLFLAVPTTILFKLDHMVRKGGKEVYQSSATAQGRLSVDLREEGMEFSGMDFRLKTNWSQVWKVSEDRRGFLIHHRSQPPTTLPLSWQIVPKRDLSSDEISQFRQYLQRKIPARARNRK